ncbi:biotin--[acetyl-CoA-carboxylase] ligase [Pedobacter alpinus]|uniref:Biotin--[acetyl-CoA-carboxylase] ligase n=1 Tax=Pedobacter alpinus TaxID=1590643 RepID=A0ABW5TNF5_9SPHI
MQNNIFITLFVGQSLIKLSEVDSTNSYLKNLLSNSKPLPDGTVIMADHQYAGRGQSNNEWQTEYGKNLTFSIYLKPNFLRLNHQFNLNKAISLGINDCLTIIIGEGCKIKWPNDIYYENQKLGGVLIENITSGSNIKASIIGIGLNVNQIVFDKNLNNVTSISKILQKDYDLTLLLSQLCKYIESRYLQLKANKVAVIDNDYIQKLYRYNVAHNFEIAGVIEKATIKGISPIGKLQLDINQQIAEFDLKEVKFIFD